MNILCLFFDCDDFSKQFVPWIKAHKVFKGLARRGKTSVGWFYGFKVHLVIDDRGELLAAVFTPGNVTDRRPVPKLVRRLFGKLFGDHG